MDSDKLNVISSGKGFIAAMDQSGGSIINVLEKYGVFKDRYSDNKEMFNLVNEMRLRVINNKFFNSNYILGVILFSDILNYKINNLYLSDYLWRKKNIVSFLKVDNGLSSLSNGVRFMNDIDDLSDKLIIASKMHVFGTKMRSVIYSADRVGIRKLVRQQFEYAKVICSRGFVPIIEPEVDINSKDKDLCESILKDEIISVLDNWDINNKIMFKFTIPSVDNLYLDLYKYSCVIRIVAMSGGYSLDESVYRLSKNNRMIACFSRSLFEGLNIEYDDYEFSRVLKSNIEKIYNASLT